MKAEYPNTTVNSRIERGIPIRGVLSRSKPRIDTRLLYIQELKRTETVKRTYLAKVKRKLTDEDIRFGYSGPEFNGFIVE